MKKYFGLIFILFWGCSSPNETYWQISGPAMGTRYNITCSNGDRVQIQNEVESLLDKYNMSLSTYLSESNISRFNNADSLLHISLQDDPYFLPVLEMSRELYDKSHHSFDPTILPLLEYYGFGSNKDHSGQKSNVNLDSIMTLIGYDKINWSVVDDTLIISKQLPGIRLNFNSIAKGYGVDLVAMLLEKNNINNYLVEIGGEVRTKGMSQRSAKWRLGINTPSPDASVSDFLITIDIKDGALATSGNYRDFYTKNGVKYVHITDPRNGLNKESSLASATIIAEDCATADALATACIVLGLEESMALIDGLEGIEACFIELAEENYKLHFTENFNKYLND